MSIKRIPMQKIREKYTRFSINKKYLAMGLFLWIISFFINVWPILFLSLFCVANALLLSIDRYIQAPLDLELSTFSAILMTIKYGLMWGIAAAVLTKFAAILYNKNIRVDHIFMIVGYVLAAFLAGILKGIFPIVTVGILAAIIVNLYVVFISKYVTFLSSYEIIAYGLSNVFFNIVLFIGFSEMFLALFNLVNPLA
ncbi:MAG: hypothetical protein HGA85_00255 [Nanoarchaeota archaeon]|nr:hypothetical protein [Nanoarchaeota archaeon]